MSSKSIIITVAVFIIVAAGGAFFWINFTAPAATAPANTTSTTSVNNTTSNTTVATNTAAPTLTDAANQYAALLARLSAQKITFARVNSAADPQYGSVYALYASDIAAYKKFAPPNADMSIGVALVDLNGDAKPETIVQENMQGYCGSGGCQTDVYTKVGNSWHNVLSILAYDVALSNSKTNGYNDLLVATAGDSGAETIWRFTWGGTGYALGPAVAIWNGTAFEVAQ